MVRLRVRYVVVAVRGGEQAAADAPAAPAAGRAGAKRRRAGPAAASWAAMAQPPPPPPPDPDARGAGGGTARGKRAREDPARELSAEEWREKKPLPWLAGVTNAAAYKALERKTRADYGDMGAVTLGKSMQVRALEQHCGLMVIRVRREDLATCRELLATTSDIGGRGTVVLDVIHVAGSARLLREALLRMHKSRPSFASVPRQVWETVVASAA